MSTALAHVSPIGPYDLEAFDYHLPEEAIAQEPAAERDQARLLLLDRSTGERRHRRICDLPELLCSGDLVVFNDTKVIPARLRGTTETGARVEVLLVRASEHRTWNALVRPAKRLKPGRTIKFDCKAVEGHSSANVVATVVSAQDGRADLAFEPGVDVPELLERSGEIPLPPYIHREPGGTPDDRERYQTVYARRPGAVAAPTAGLHFTPELLERLRQRGIESAMITLHVGPGTFQPVRTGDVRTHRMEAEWCDISADAAAAIMKAKQDGRRVVAIGTTTTRALESRAMESGAVESGSGWADCFIVPGHRFRIVDALLTNFHLPRSTLLMLVAGFAGRERILDVYAEAVAMRYRFYSYGDAMLIL